MSVKVAPAGIECPSPNILSHLSHDPATALALLHLVTCDEQRRKLAALIARAWSRKDINTAWSAVTHSPLNAADKQVMYNELWS
jgi:hypothetical protein